MSSDNADAGGDSADMIPFVRNETQMEYISDLVLGCAFLLVGLAAAQRMRWSRDQGGAETNVVTAFYSLILLTSLFRSTYFLIPNSILEPSYVPHAVMAFDPDHPSWIGGFISEEILTAGSLCLFSIFILILVYWADILKKYFSPGARRSRPMHTFSNIFLGLLTIEVINAVFFLLRVYSSEGMILVNAILMAIVSIVCVVEITIFSHKFRTVLQTLGAINQVSTESQVKRIVWITVTGNLFFFTRAFIEAIFACMLIVYWTKYGTVAEVFNHSLWDTYMMLKHWSEVAILGLMLYILQSRFTSSVAGAGGSGNPGAGGNSNGGPRNRNNYQQIPEDDDAEKGKGAVKGTIAV
mmetsp:Transcript_22624/g.28545  ORF Transcript_22624/g.28545 Transcript_22624/m.28545 type:complete len:353 (-) Transcript_22624:263-1321(-)